MAKLFLALILGVYLTGCSGSEFCKRPKPEAEPVVKVESETTVKPDESDIKNVPKCSGNPESLVSGRLVNGSIPRDDNLLPPWVNLTLARQGQKFAMDHLPSLSSSHLFGLIFVLTFPDAYTVLLFTNQSDTPDRAAKRYLSTLTQVNTWYSNELQDESGEGNATLSLLRVRGLHTAAMNAGNNRLYNEKGNLINSDLYERIPIDEGMWTAFKKDLDASEIPESSRKLPESHSNKEGSTYAVNQFQLAMTQFAFIGFPVLFPERLHIIDATDDELIAYNHLWAVLGYALGIDDEYNVALQPDLKSTRENYQKIFDEWYLPNLFNIDFHCKVLVEAMLQGFEKINDVFTPRTLLLRMLKDIVNIPTPNMRRELTPKDHHKMLQFFATGIKGMVEKIRGDVMEQGLPAVIQKFREAGGPQKILEQIRGKLPQFGHPQGRS